MNSRLALWTYLIRLTWRTSPLKSCLILLTLAVSIASAPLLALMLRDFTNVLLIGHFSAATPYGAATAVLWALADQSAEVRDHLRYDMFDRLGIDMSERIVRLIAEVPGIEHLENTETLDRISIVSRSGYAICDTIWVSAETAGNVLSVAATLLVLSTVSPVLLLTLPLAVPTLWFNRVGRARTQAAMREASEAQRTADQILETVFDPAVAIELRVTGAATVLLDEYESRWDEATRLTVRAQRYAAVLLTVGWVVFLAGFGGSLAFAAWQIRAGHANASDIILLLTVSRQLQTAVQATVGGLGQMINGFHAVEAFRWLREYAAGQARPQDPIAVPDRLHSGITLDDVSFTYPGTERAVMRHITAEFPAGSMVALVGSHGSGKTSLVKLLTQMYQPTQGTVRVDGIPLPRIEPSEWRSRVTCGFQDFVHFQTVARTSVGIGDLPHAHDEPRVSKAVRRGGAQSVVDNLPDGLNTQLGTIFGGIELSGGQWQKIALSRTCMRDQPLLCVLDEPTASLDPVSEYEIFQRHVVMAREIGRSCGAVTIIVTHRFSTVRMADKIIVLADGEIVEEGDHNSLMAAEGHYAKLYRLQADAYMPSLPD